MQKSRWTLGAERRRNHGCARRWKAMLMGHIVTPPGHLARGRLGVCVLVALLLMPGVVRAQPMRWQDAVTALAEERTRVEECVRVFKRHMGGDAAALSRGALAYTEAKAEVD